MTKTTHPDKQLVRAYLLRRKEVRECETLESEPPPSLEDIRRELDWRVKDSAEVERE